LDFRPLDEILSGMSPVEPDHLIPLLQRIQDAYGYLPRGVVLDACTRTGLPASRVFGVATFYEQFHLEPRGRHLVRCCRGTACHVRGGDDVIKAVKQTLQVEDGGTTEDGLFTLETVACLGTCALAPVVVVDSRYHGKMTPRSIRRLVQTMAREEVP
jgi:NADH-quinone oxidoreductase subunit E